MNFPHHVTLIMFRSKGKVAWWEGLWLNAVSSQQKKLFSYWNTFLPIHKLWCLYCGTKAKFHNLHLEELIIVSCNSKFSSVQSLNHGWLFATPWTAARQASLSITNSRSLLKLMSIELVMPSNHLILYRPSPSLPAFNLSQHQGLFQWVSSSHQVVQVLELQHQSFQWKFRTDFLQDWPVWSLSSSRYSQESSPTPQFNKDSYYKVFQWNP